MFYFTEVEPVQFVASLAIGSMCRHSFCKVFHQLTVAEDSAVSSRLFFVAVGEVPKPVPKGHNKIKCCSGMMGLTDVDHCLPWRF